MPALNVHPSTPEQISEVWNHFTRVSPTLARCNLCQKSFKPPSTTQYWDHLRSHHKEVYATTEYYKTGNDIRHRKLPSAFKFTEDQRKVLEESFGRGQFPSDEDRTSIAQQLGVQESSVKNWFQGRRNKERRMSDGSQPIGGAAAADEANDHEEALGEVSQCDIEMSEADSEQLEEENAAEPETEPNRAALHGPLPMLDPRFLHSPQPVAPPPPATQATEDGIVELSGRAMILRLRQLYEKDHKAFLRAQNDISNALFKYEMEDE